MAKIIKQLVDANNNLIYPIAYNMGGCKIDLLWTNPSPTSSWASGTVVSLDLSEYQLLLCVATASDAIEVTNNSMVVPVDGLEYAIGTNINVSNTGFSGRVTSFTATTTGVTIKRANNSVPIKIYGIKTSYVVPTEVQGLQYVEVE